MGRVNQGGGQLSRVNSLESGGECPSAGKIEEEKRGVRVESSRLTTCPEAIQTSREFSPGMAV
jgi:hypothetical protein